MKKILNSKETLIEDMLAGFIAAEGKRVAQSSANSQVLFRKEKKQGKSGSSVVEEVVMNLFSLDC